MALQFRRGTAAERSASSVVPEVGEPWFTYDDGQLYVGDGVAVGGVNVGSNVDLEGLADVTTIKESIRTITNYEISSNVVAVTVSFNHDYYEGLIVDISGSSIAALNGSHTVTGIIGLTTFTFDLIASNVSSTIADGTVTPQIPEGSAIIWNQTDGIWEDQPIARSIDDLTDVDISTVAIADKDILIFNGTTSKLEPLSYELGNVNDVDDTYLSDPDPLYSSEYLGKVLRRNFEGEWAPYSTGETISETVSTNYIGTDFLPAYDDLYGGNTALWTKTADFAEVNDGITNPQPPYGGSLESGILYWEPTTPPTSTSTDFTVDFWA
ncbi:MAG: hypothetical protein ACO23V_12005, partial [Chitinophagaceae bacterium]